MKLVNRKSIFFYIMCISIMFMNSCAQTPPYEEAIKIIVTPHKLSVCSGSEDKVFVKLLDKQGGPLFGVEVKAVSTTSRLLQPLHQGINGCNWQDNIYRERHFPRRHHHRPFCCRAKGNHGSYLHRALAGKTMANVGGYYWMAQNLGEYGSISKFYFLNKKATLKKP